MTTTDLRPPASTPGGAPPDPQVWLAAIVASSDDAIIGKTLDGLVLSWNDAAERIYGYSAAEMIGQSITRLAPAERADEIPGLLARVRRGDRIERLETVRQRKDGTRVEVSLTLSPIRDASGRPIGVSTIAREIGARKEAERRLRQTQELLEQHIEERTRDLRVVNAALDGFRRSVSHDLGAYLRHITNFAELALDEVESDPRPHLERVLALARQTRTLMEGLLALARSAPLPCDAVDVDALVREVIAQFAPDVQGRAVRWEVGALGAVPGHRALLLLVWLNLLSNALKFTRQRAEARIAIARANLDGHAVFTIGDNGVGFDPAEAGRLFEQHVRLHDPDDFEGAGLGLENVRRIVERLGGRAWAHAVPDGGATFAFCLPLAPAPDGRR